MVRRKGIREAHNKGQPNELHSVEVDGVRYRSTWAAWLRLKISGTMSDCVRFRGELKKSESGELDHYDAPTRKTYTFKLIPFNSKYLGY